MLTIILYVPTLNYEYDKEINYLMNQLARSFFYSANMFQLTTYNFMATKNVKCIHKIIPLDPNEVNHIKCNE